MYVKIYHRHRGQWDATLVDEMTARQLKQVKREYPNRLHLPITAAEAHKWVRQGGVHGTALYIDQDNRIRRAGE